MKKRKIIEDSKKFEKKNFQNHIEQKVKNFNQITLALV
jgi:hypothetical protein